MIDRDHFDQVLLVLIKQAITINHEILKEIIPTMLGAHNHHMVITGTLTTHQCHIRVVTTRILISETLTIPYHKL